MILYIFISNDNAPRFFTDYRPVLSEHQPARKVIEVMATDDDDWSKGNGPPFTFRMDPKATWKIKASFKVEYDPSKSKKFSMYVFLTKT